MKYTIIAAIISILWLMSPSFAQAEQPLTKNFIQCIRSAEPIVSFNVMKTDVDPNQAVVWEDFVTKEEFENAETSNFLSNNFEGVHKVEIPMSDDGVYIVDIETEEWGEARIILVVNEDWVEKHVEFHYVDAVGDNTLKTNINADLWLTERNSFAVYHAGNLYSMPKPWVVEDGFEAPPKKD